ncbi:MAG: response regulator, partial [Ramlibacter sp.]
RALIEEAAGSRSLAHRLEEDIAGFGSVQAHQQRLAKDLQHMVMGTRMSEVAVLESRLQRAVRSTCQATGKQATLKLLGGETLIDSDVLARLADPLMHILRNAVDHGLEAPPARVAAGKDPGGRIELSFSRQGQQVVLRCRDDGAGLDLAAVRRRALERGLINDAQVLDDEEMSRLILLPGFSTRNQVSEISGRGVGLDVVRDWVGAMHGSIRISTRSGEGCTMELRFAASLSTMHSLIVEAGGRRFALPSVQIEQAVSRGLGAFLRQGDQLVYRHGKRALPALRLTQLTGVSAALDKPLDECDVVIVRHEQNARALAVDRLVDSRELLVKSPGRYARHIRGVAGLSILGDGGIAVNLDLAQLLAAGVAHLPRLQTATPAPVKSAQQQPGVLIVDDALIVRDSLAQLARDAGFRAQTARDGMEAIDAMRTFRPDLVLTDLEMPNMDGLELTAHIRGREDLRDLPVIMITSRSQEKHRRLAEQAGVSTYLTKPYNDSDLLGTMREALAA